MTGIMDVLAEMSQFLGSAAGQRTALEVIDRLHPAKRVSDAISNLPDLGPPPRKEPKMADTLVIPAKILNFSDIVQNGKVTVNIPHATEPGVAVPVAFTPEEIISAFVLGLQLYGSSKIILGARPAEEPEFIKFTYVYEGTASQVASAARQIYTDIKD